MSAVTSEPVEDLESFRERARAFAATLQPITQRHPSTMTLPDEEELAEVQKDRAVQRALFDAGLAGIAIPKEYGGQGLTKAHQDVLNQELRGKDYPIRLQAPNFSPCAAVLLDFGTEEQKKEHIPKILKGEEIWMQLLSEPGNGSDVAAAQLTAVRDGDEWVLNGSKIWTTGAWWADWGLVLARTNWDVPKHRGLTVFIMPIQSPGVELHRIEMLNGNKEFCQEYFSDVRVPDTDRIGTVDEGWTVGTRWMFHERMLYSSPYITLPAGTQRGVSSRSSMVDIARTSGRLEDTAGRELLGEAFMLDMVQTALKRRVSTGIAARAISDQSAAIARLFGGISTARGKTVLYELAGATGGAWGEDDGAAGATGVDYLMRQAACIGGGTTEIARNVIAERVLGMPREASGDRDVPFRDVPRGGTQRA